MSTMFNLDYTFRKLFESSPGKNEPKIFKSVKNYYKSCMDQVKRTKIFKSVKNYFKSCMDQVKETKIFKSVKNY